MFDFSEGLKTLEKILEDWSARLPTVLLALIVFLLFYIFSRLVRRVVHGVSNRYRRDQNLGVVMGRLAQWFVLLVGLLVALVIIFPTFSPAQMIQLLGIGSVAASFAFRDILENFMAGILLLINEPFRIGDQIVIEGVEGTVLSIDARATVIRTYDGRRVVVPNNELFTNKVTVNTAFEKRRLEYDFGVGYDSDLRSARQLMLEAMGEVEHVMKEPAPDVLLLDLGDFSVKLRARWWITPPFKSDALESYDEVLGRIKEKLTEHGIDLPFPTQKILLPNAKEEKNGSHPG